MSQEIIFDPFFKVFEGIEPWKLIIATAVVVHILHRGVNYWETLSGLEDLKPIYK